MNIDTGYLEGSKHSYKGYVVFCEGPCKEVTAKLKYARGDPDLYGREGSPPDITSSDSDCNDCPDCSYSFVLNKRTCNQKVYRFCNFLSLENMFPITSFVDIKNRCLDQCWSMSNASIEICSLLFILLNVIF